MNTLNKDSSREEIRAYIDNIMQRDKNKIKIIDEDQNNTVKSLKDEMATQLKTKDTSTNSKVVEFDNLKAKVLKYIMYKKRTEKEVRTKFSSLGSDQNMLEDVIENLKENGYIDDESYIARAVNEFLAINTVSLKEMRNKLYAKGINNDIIDIYFSEHEEELEEYELSCAKKIAYKKQSQMEQKDIEAFLYRKGYRQDSIKQAFEE